MPKTKVSFNDLGVQKVKQNTFHAYDILLDPSQKRKIKSQLAFSIPIVAGIAAVFIILLGGIFYLNQNNQTDENKSHKSSKPIILVEPFKIIGENKEKILILHKVVSYILQSMCIFLYHLSNLTFNFLSLREVASITVPLLPCLNVALPVV